MSFDSDAAGVEYELRFTVPGLGLDAVEKLERSRFIQGARWQHEQDAREIEELRAVIKELGDALGLTKWACGNLGDAVGIEAANKALAKAKRIVGE